MKIVYYGHPTPPTPPAYIHTTLFARIFSVPPSHAKYATTMMMSTTGRAQMVAVRYTRARTRRINSLTHTHARAKRHTDAAAARRRRRRKQRTQHVTTTYERSPCLRLYESLSLALTHSLREATHCWAETRRTASTSCPLSRKAAVTLKRGPRALLRRRSNRLYVRTHDAIRARTQPCACAYASYMMYIIYIYMYTTSRPLPYTVQPPSHYHLPMPSPPHKLYYYIHIYACIYIILYIL